MHSSTSLKPFKKFVGVAAALMILPVAVACSAPAEDIAADTTSEVPTAIEADTNEPLVTEPETIVDIAIANGSFDTLVSAIEAAGLTDRLEEEGEYTIFAPTDEAFAALPEGTLEMLLMPENKALLTQVLSYHITSGKIASSDIESGPVFTMEGEELTVTADESGVTVNQATVVQSDAMASNGIIHTIDTVLLPPSLDLSVL